MLDIALNAKTHDIVLTDGDILFIDNAERVAQQIKIALLTFYGEWFLDVTRGIPYLEYILIKSPNFAIIRELFREAIENVDDVSLVNDINLEFDSAKRELSVEYEASTEYGLVSRKERLGYGN